MQTPPAAVKRFSPNGSGRSANGLAGVDQLSHSAPMSTHRPRTLLLATIALWTVAFIAWTADALVEPVPFALERALRRLPLCIGAVVMCIVLGRLLQRIRGCGTWLVGACTALGVLICSLLYALANELVLYVIDPHWGAPAWVHVPDVAMLVLWVFMAWALLYFALRADAERRDREVLLAQANAATLEAQHRLLLMQLNPHFLFNALNTIYALVLDHDTANARRGLLALSAFLRRSVDANAPTLVTLAEELESLRNYLEIERARFGDRLHVVETVPARLLECRVPALILQPLVENCIKHGVARCSRPVTIELSANGAESHLVLAVTDNGPAGAGDPAILGTGLGNVARRLQLLYGADGRLSLLAHPHGGFVASIELPACAA